MSMIGSIFPASFAFETESLSSLTRKDVVNSSPSEPLVDVSFKGSEILAPYNSCHQSILYCRSHAVNVHEAVARGAGFVSGTLYALNRDSDTGPYS